MGLPPIIAKEFNNWQENKQKWKLVAAIFNKKPVSVAYNDLKKTHPLTAKGYKGYLARTHAEIRCIRNTPPSCLKGATIVVARANDCSHLQMARPCSICMKIIREVGIKKIIYSDNNGNFIEERL